MKEKESLFMHTTFIALIALVLLTGCGRRGRQGSYNDSTAVVQVPIEQLMLPDTAFASADAVKYVVENTDSVATPLRDLDDRRRVPELQEQ